jgi:molybdate transport system substrate-binding protein
MSKLWVIAAATSVLAAFASTTATAVELKFLSPPSLKTVMNEIIPRFENDSGHKLAIAWEVMPAMKRQIEAGRDFDVAILPPDLMQAVIETGKASAATRTEFARTAIGVAVRKGAPRPDLSSVASTRRMLLDAKSIAYTSDGAVGNAFLALLERLGIAAEVKPKLMAMPGGGTVEPVARGEAELAVTTIPGILEVPGAELAGRLPSELQTYVVYSAAVATASQNAVAATAFIRSLTTPSAIAVIKSKGLELVTP